MKLSICCIAFKIRLIVKNFIKIKFEKFTRIPYTYSETFHQFLAIYSESYRKYMQINSQICRKDKTIN